MDELREPAMNFPSLSRAPHLRQRAAGLIQREGRVLLHRVVGDAFWALPGGGIEAGESAAQALVRELQEELGQAVEPGALACVVENFFTYAGATYHEIGLYLHAEPLPGSQLLSGPGPYVGVEGPRALEFAWFSPSELGNLEVRPAFLKDFLQRWLAQGALEVAHIVHRDA